MFKNETVRLRVLRLGAILGNYAIFGATLLMLLALLPAATVIFFFFAAIVLVFILCVWLLTLGQLFQAPDTSFLSANGPVFEAISRFAQASAPYLFTLTAVFAVVSLIIAALDRRQQHVGRIVFSSLSLGAAVLGMILVYAIGGTV